MIIKVIKVLFVLSALLFIYSLVCRPPDIDDSWLGEHAYWQAKLGFVKSELMHGITHQEIRFLCHHKLLTLQGALFINLFGFSVYTLKSVSLIYFLAFFGIFYLYTYRKLLSPLEFWFSILLFITNALIFQFAFVFRPEIPVMTLGFISYIFLDKSLKSNRSGILYISVSGLFAGLCIATHLNGIVFLIAGFLLLIWHKRYLHGLIFGFASIPTVLLYFYDFTASYNFRFWLYQLNKTPAHNRMSDLPVGLNYLNNLLNEHLNFFHSPLEISFSILLIASLIFLGKQLKPQRDLIRYTALLAVSLALLSVHKSSKYMIIYLPYLLILISMVIKFMVDKELSKTIFRGKYTYAMAGKVIIALIITYLSINIYYDYSMATDKYQPEKVTELISSHIDGPAAQYRIVAPMEFFFYGINRFKSIQSELCYTEMQKSNKSIYEKGFLDMANSFHIDYIILSEQYIKDLGMDKVSAIELSESRFGILFKIKSLMIMRKLKQN